MMARTKMEVEKTTIGDDCTLPDDVQIATYRIAQEALNNIVKHSRASRVIVNLKCEPEQIVLTIRDDGNGFDPHTIKQDNPDCCLGLGIMRERAQSINAEFVLNSKPGQGTEITVTWTIPEQNDHGGPT